MSDLELKIISALFSSFAGIIGVSVAVHGMYSRIDKKRAVKARQEQKNQTKEILSAVEKIELKTELAINKALSPQISRIDTVEKDVKELKNDVKDIKKVQSENLQILADYKARRDL